MKIIKKINFIIIAIFVLGSVSVISVKNVFACTPVYRTAQESFDNADIVFTGKVMSFATSTEVVVYDGKSFPIRVSSINLRVNKYWKGNPLESVNIKSTAAQGYSCPIILPKIGDEYLVYANLDKTSNSFLVSFSEMKEISSSRSEIVSLGAGLTIATNTKVNKPSVLVNASAKNNTDTKIVMQTNVKPTAAINTDAKSHDETPKSSFVARVFMWIKNLFK